MKYNKDIKNNITGSDYCTIILRKELIICSYFRVSQHSFSQYYQIDLFSSSADLLFNLINQHDNLSHLISLSHALYLGKEIYKAELAQYLLQSYIQT